MTRILDYIEDFPLTWPNGWPRTERPRRSAFDTPLIEAQLGLLDEIRLLGGRDPIISSNVETYWRSGRKFMRKSQAKSVEDCGVAVYFTLDGDEQVFACDQWDRLQDNLQAIRLTIGALRGIQRWGSSEMLRRVFTGFEALPSSATAGHPRTWWGILGFETADHSREEFEAAYRRLAKKHHPDQGGSNEVMAALNEAIGQARENGRRADDE